jgi:hypothetical protein
MARQLFPSSVVRPSLVHLSCSNMIGSHKLHDNCCDRHSSSSSSSSIIFFFRDEELGWMDDGMDGWRDGWQDEWMERTTTTGQTKDII